MQSANQTFPFLVHLIESVIGAPFSPPIPIETFSISPQAEAAATELKTLFDRYGSDKARRHNYHHLYGHILSDRNAIAHLLEIGLGTNNTAVVSNMGSAGSPGASLRAFRDFLPGATIHGADIDRSVLFEEPNIITYFLDQTNLQSFDDLSAIVGQDFDIIIDDGLHAPNANIASLAFACKRLKPGGWSVVEDINPAALPVWRV
ncbi:MAG: hypothetical protein WA459_21570 [Stellaceae bacterium]